jgi:GMP synthase - Glutamine amidotransferase domain
MKIHVFRHLEFEGLGMIGEWIQDKGYTYTETRFWENTLTYPDPNQIDMLIIMGGSMNVDEEDQYPWLVEERQFIRKAMDTNVKILGVCLGAQLISRASGKEVIRSPYKEIGWFPVSKLFSNHTLFPNLKEEEVTVMQWHGDMFEIPEDSERLFASAGCPNQAFSMNENRVVGLQFHLELSKQYILPFFDNDEDEELKVKAPYIQTPDEIKAGCGKYDVVTRELLFDLLNVMAELPK